MVEGAPSILHSERALFEGPDGRDVARETVNISKREDMMEVVEAPIRDNFSWDNEDDSGTAENY